MYIYYVSIYFFLFLFYNSNTYKLVIFLQRMNNNHLLNFFDLIEYSYLSKISKNSKYYHYVDLSAEADIRKYSGYENRLFNEFAIIPVSPAYFESGMIIDLPNCKWANLDSGISISQSLANILELNYEPAYFGNDIYAYLVHQFIR